MWLPFGEMSEGISNKSWGIINMEICSTSAQWIIKESKEITGRISVVAKIYDPADITELEYRTQFRTEKCYV